MNPTSLHETNGSKIKAYAILILFSIISAVLIYLVWVPLWAGWIAQHIFAVFLIMIIQNVLIVPTTKMVISLHKQLSNSAQIHRTLLFLIPTGLNVLAANSLLVIAGFAFLWQGTQEFILVNKHQVTIQEESIHPIVPTGPNKLAEYEYYAILHLENCSGFPITRMNYSLTALAENELKGIHTGLSLPDPIDYGSWDLSDSNTVYSDTTNLEIPIHMSLYNEYDVLTCGDVRLEKQLYLVYSLEFFESRQAIAVGDEIRQKIKELACTVQP